jgi:Na+(H+)/acetate symporter ActP
MQTDMKTNATSVTEALGSAVHRLLPLLATLAAMAGVGFLFSSFIDLVQSWAVTIGCCGMAVQ